MLPLVETQLPADAVATFVQTEAVESVCVHFKDFLVNIFQAYAVLPGGDDGDDADELEYDEDGNVVPPPAHELELEFAAFVKMCRRFEFVSPQVTNALLGRLFALCLDDPLGFEPTGAHATLDASQPRVRLTLPEFVEAFCRCALLGAEHDARLSQPLHVADKIRSLLAHIYKAALLRKGANFGLGNSSSNSNSSLGSGSGSSLRSQRGAATTALLIAAMQALKTQVHRVWEREQRVSVETGISAAPPMRGDRGARMLAAAQVWVVVCATVWSLSFVCSFVRPVRQSDAGSFTAVEPGLLSTAS